MSIKVLVNKEDVFQWFIREEVADLKLNHQNSEYIISEDGEIVTFQTPSYLRRTYGPEMSYLKDKIYSNYRAEAQKDFLKNFAVPCMSVNLPYSGDYYGNVYYLRIPCLTDKTLAEIISAFLSFAECFGHGCPNEIWVSKLPHGRRLVHLTWRGYWSPPDVFLETTKIKCPVFNISWAEKRYYLRERRRSQFEKTFIGNFNSYY